MAQAAKTERPRVPAAPVAEVPRDTAGAAHPRPPYLLALASAVAVFALYAFTLAPTTAFWDTSEYIATAHIVGIPHPPGNPLFVLLARAWELLLSPTGLATAVRVNLFSAFMSAATAFFWYLTVHRVLGWFDTRENVRRVGAAVSVLVAATAFTVWNQGNVNEKVYTVSMATIAALTWLAFVWREHTEEHRGVRGRFNDDNAIVLMVFILALSVANHMMAILAVPALVLLLLMVKPGALSQWEFYAGLLVIAVLGAIIGPPAMILALVLVAPRNWKLHASAVAFFVLGLSLHLFLSIRAGLHPIINEASPTCASVADALTSIVTYGKAGCENLSAALLREQYGKPSLTDRQAPFVSQMATYFQYFDWQWARSVAGTQGYLAGPRLFITLVALALGGFGALEHFRRDRKSFAYLAVLFLTLSVGLTVYMNFKYGFGQVRASGMNPDLAEVRERDYFFLISFSLWGLWAGLGLVAFWLRVQEGVRSPRRALATSPVLLVALLPLLLNWKYADRSDDHAARNLAYNLLQSVEPYGVLFTNGDNDTFPLWYLQEVEGIRRDVTVIVGTYLNTDWYAKQLRGLTGPCPTPDAWERDRTRILCQRPFDPTGAPSFYGNPARPTKSILPLSDAQIDAIMVSAVPLPEDAIFEARGMQATIPGQRYLTPADQLMLTIIKEAWGDRPIFFASTGDAHRQLGLAPFVTRTGLAYRLTTPQEAQRFVAMPPDNPYYPILGAYVDVDRHRKLVWEAFQYGDLINRPAWPDDATRGFPTYYANAHLALAQAEGMLGNQAEADRNIKRTEEWMAVSQR